MSTEAPAQPKSAVVTVDPPAPPAAPAAAPQADDVDIDCDRELIQFKIRLGGQRFLVTEASIETQKLIAKALDDLSNEVEERMRAAEEKNEDDAGDVDGYSVIDSIYPQLEHIFKYIDGPEQGKPPAKEFVAQHLRTSTLRRIMRKLNPSTELTTMRVPAGEPWDMDVVAELLKTARMGRPGDVLVLSVSAQGND